MDVLVYLLISIIVKVVLIITCFIITKTVSNRHFIMEESITDLLLKHKWKYTTLIIFTIMFITILIIEYTNCRIKI